jgi:hypothetical protein
MNKRDMLLGGPGLDGYAFQADTYCVPCGQAIIRALPQENYPDDLAGDSAAVPQPIFFGEHDRAVHCADCGAYMYGEEESE